MKEGKRIQREGSLIGTISLLMALGVGAGVQAAGTPTPSGRAAKARAHAAYGQLPLSFEANRGQSDPRVKFLSRGEGYTAFLTPTEAVLVLRAPGATASERNDVLRLRLVGAHAAPRVAGLEELPGRSHYLIGRDPSKWRTNVPAYAKVEYEDVYPGIDLLYYGNRRQLEHDFIVAPGADPKQIRFEVQGAQGIEIDAEGNLVLRMAGEDARLQKPHLYQDSDGSRRTIQGSYVLHTVRKKGKASTEVGFQVATYDVRKTLVIDPVLLFSTYLGGSGHDSGEDIAVDTAGNAYVTGTTMSADFPFWPDPAIQPPGPYDSTCGIDGKCDGASDVFVTKLDPTGSAILYSTFLGGSGNDKGHGIAVDVFEQAYVTGEASPSFPTTPGAYQTSGYSPAFAARLSASGSSLLYSTFLAGSNGAIGKGIAVFDAGSGIRMYVTGRADSYDFPTKNAYQPQAAFGGVNDAFVTVLDPSQPGPSQLVYSTFLGGYTDDEGDSIAVGLDGTAYVTGHTLSTNLNTTLFPTKNAVQALPGGGRDAFVARIDPSLAGSASLVFSTFLGGSDYDNDEIQDGGIAVDAAGNVYVTGSTRSSDLNTTPNAFQPTYSGTQDAFVAKIDTSPALVYLSYLGGTSSDFGKDIAVDPFGNAYVTGYTISSDFPGSGAPVAPKLGGGGPGQGDDAFVVRVDPSQSGVASLVSATYFGGTHGDFGYGIAVDFCGNAYLTGDTGSKENEGFPLLSAVQPTHGADPVDGKDAFVAKIGGLFVPYGSADLSLTKAASPDPVLLGGVLTYTLDVINNGPDTASSVWLVDQLPPSVTPINPPCPWDPVNNTITCQWASVPVGTITVTIQVTPNTVGTITNHAKVWSATSPNLTVPPTCDPDGSNDTASVETVVLPATDLEVTKAGPPTAHQGTQLTYTLTVTNLGPSDATGVTITDTLPTNVTLVQAPACQSDNAVPPTLTCPIGTLLNGQSSVPISVTVLVGAGPTVTNTAKVSGAEADPNSLNDKSTVITTVTLETDLQVTNSDAPDPVDIGAILTYTLVAKNNGPSPATGVTLTDALAGNVSFVSAQGCTYAPQLLKVTCSIGNLASGQSAPAFTVRVVVNSGSNVTNTASVKGNETDSTPGNNSDTELTAIKPADLSVNKTGPLEAPQYSLVTYTIVATNAGSGAAGGVTLKDTLPPGMVFQSAPGCTQFMGSVTCLLGTLNSGTSATRTIKAWASTAGAKTNKVTVQHNGNDPVPGNNTDTHLTHIVP